MRFFTKLSLRLLFAVLFFAKCQAPPQTGQGVRLDLSQKPYERLSQYQFFVGEMKNLQPNKRVIPYDLNSPLFSDYADKSRFV